MAIDETPRCLSCEGKTISFGAIQIQTGHGHKTAKKVVCRDCGVGWGIYDVELPNRQIKSYQKRLTNPHK